MTKTERLKEWLTEWFQENDSVTFDQIKQIEGMSVVQLQGAKHTLIRRRWLVKGEKVKGTQTNHYYHKAPENVIDYDTGSYKWNEKRFR